MENPLTKFVPQLFGEYPKPFLKLINNISFSPDQDSQEVTPPKKIETEFEGEVDSAIASELQEIQALLKED